MQLAIAGLKLELKAIDEELKEIDEALKAKDDLQLSMSVWQYFLEDGKRLPQPNQIGKATGASANKKHTPINSYVEHIFGIVPMSEEERNNCKRTTASIPFLPETFDYATEADIQQECKTFLKNIIHAVGIKLSLISDLAISELKADFWVVTTNGFPVGAIEVK